MPRSRAIRLPLHLLPAVLVAALGLSSIAAAHSPSVSQAQGSTPAEAVVLEDATLSRAIGATLQGPPARWIGTVSTWRPASPWWSV